MDYQNQTALQSQEQEPWYMNGGKEEWIERMKLYDPEGYAEWLIERREKDRIRYANLTREQKDINNEKSRIRYANRTEEQKEKRREKDRIRKQKKRDEKRKAELKDDNPPLSFL